MPEIPPTQKESSSNGIPIGKSNATTDASFIIDPITGQKIVTKDGKPCRVCSDFKTWSRLEKAKSKPSSENSSTIGSSSNATSSKNSTNQPSQSTSMPQLTEQDLDDLADLKRSRVCPPDSVQLGRATWTFLHTMAAYYPTRPSPSQQTSMRSFLKSFSDFYPCWYCAEHLRERMEKFPPKVGSRKDLGLWLCDCHNEVNERLGKEQFDCNKWEERWKDGPKDGSCD